MYEVPEESEAFVKYTPPTDESCPPGVRCNHDPRDFPWPNNKVCVRQDYHDGPCNGLPRDKCFVYHDQLGIAIPLGEHSRFQPNDGKLYTIRHDPLQQATYGDDRRNPDYVCGQGYGGEGEVPVFTYCPEGIQIPMILKTYEPQKKPWHLLLRQHLYNLRRKWKLHIYWGDSCGRCDPY